MAKHHEEIAPYGIHVVHFKGATDPSLDAGNFVTAGKLWWDTSASPALMKCRNDANDDWDTLYEIGAVAAGSLGTAAALDSDTDGTLAADSDLKVPTQKATKTYVDAKVAGLSWKQAVRAATTAAGTLATDFENGDAVDGVTLVTGDRILVKNQAAGAENGIYVVAASGAPTRAADADSGAELVNATVYVSEGTANADTQWTCATNAAITVGVTALAFAQLTSGGGGIPQSLIDAVGDLIYGSADNTPARLAGNTTTTKKFLTQTGDGGASAAPTWGTVAATDLPNSLRDVAIPFVIDGGGAEITTGVKGFIEVPFSGTIVSVRLLADQSGSIVVDIWKDAYANYPPTNADSITASAVPTISGATKSEDTTLTGWTTAVAAGDILGFNVDSVTTIERVTASLVIRRG